MALEKGKLRRARSKISDYISECEFGMSLMWFNMRQTSGKKCISCWCGALSPLDICPLACITSGKKNTKKYYALYGIKD